MKKQKFWKTIFPLTLTIIIIIFFTLVISVGLTRASIGYLALSDFCQDRGYITFSHIEMWNYKGNETLSIICENSEGQQSFTESIPVYNEVFNKPSGVRK